MVFLNKLRILLIPFSWIYGFVVSVRNLCYNNGFFKSFSIPKKSICVGNLSVGGTGKTPLVDLIAHHFIENNIQVSTLSRGYGRTTKGLIEVNENSLASDVGDEPLLYKSKYKDDIHVVVAEERKSGVEYILNSYPTNDLIILDDAFQHRSVKAGFNILVTDYSNLFVNDFLLPAGNLREPISATKRADVIVVSKCPQELSADEKKIVADQIKFPTDKIFFSSIEYDDLIGFNSASKKEVENILLVTGIGNPTSLVEYLRKTCNVEHLRFKDHHRFTPQDITQIHEKFDSFASRSKIIVTTEKDFMRLRHFAAVKKSVNRWYYQPITIKIDEQIKFNLLINEYVIEN